MTTRHIKKKLKKYVDRDDFNRLKSYFRKHRHSVSLDELIYEEGDSLLHLVCQAGQDHVVWYLLKEGADPLQQNDMGQTPLHCACVFTLTESHYAFYDLVKPLMEKYPRAMGIADRKGKTPRDLVQKIKHLLNNKGANVQEDSSSSSTSSVSDRDDWEERMKYEVDAEYTESWGTYEQDFTDYRDEPGTSANTDERESYDKWSARILKDMDRKRKQKYDKLHPEHAKRRKLKQDAETKAREKAEFQRKLECEHLEYQKRARSNRQQRLSQAKTQYEKRCTEVFGEDSDSKESLGYGDIPWPTPSKWDKQTDSLKEFMVCDLDVKDTKSVRKYLRMQQVRWHPDRFRQKCHGRIKSNEEERIMDKVKLISQLLNNIIADMEVK